MPIYEYECTACGHRLEAIQKFSDTPLQECPACKVASLTRLMSAPAFHLKGSGWYVTDFKDKPAKKKEDGQPEPAKTTEAAASTPAAPENEAKTPAKAEPVSASSPAV